MSKRDRGGLFKVVTALTVALVFWLTLKTTWFLSALNTEYSQYAEEAAEEYASSTQQRIESTCTDRNLPAFSECVGEIVESTKEAQRAERDLAAQRRMALWTLGMFWASVAAVGVTAIGLWFVWRTLEATRMGTSAAVEAAKEAAEANRIMRDEQRPWIRIIPRLPNGVRIVGDALQVDVSPVFKNIGARPAYDVWIEAKAVLPGQGVLGNVTAQFFQFWTDVNNRRLRPIANGQIVFPNEPGGGMNFSQQIRGQDLNGADLTKPDTALLPHIFVCCVYRLAVNGPLHVTARSYMLMRTDAGVTKIITVESCDLPEDAIIADPSLQPSYVS